MRALSRLAQAALGLAACGSEQGLSPRPDDTDVVVEPSPWDQVRPQGDPRFEFAALWFDVTDLSPPERPFRWGANLPPYDDTESAGLWLGGAGRNAKVSYFDERGVALTTVDLPLTACGHEDIFGFWRGVGNEVMVLTREPEQGVELCINDSMSATYTLWRIRPDEDTPSPRLRIVYQRRSDTTYTTPNGELLYRHPGNLFSDAWPFRPQPTYSWKHPDFLWIPSANLDEPVGLSAVTLLLPIQEGATAAQAIVFDGDIQLIRPGPAGAMWGLVFEWVGNGVNDIGYGYALDFSDPRASRIRRYPMGAEMNTSYHHFDSLGRVGYIGGAGQFSSEPFDPSAGFGDKASVVDVACDRVFDVVTELYDFRTPTYLAVDMSSVVDDPTSTVVPLVLAHRCHPIVTIDEVRVGWDRRDPLFVAAVLMSGAP